MLLFRIVLRRPRQLVISNRRPEIDRKVDCRTTALLLVLTLAHLLPTPAGNRVGHPLAVGVGCPAPAQVRQEQERVLLQRIIDYISFVPSRSRPSRLLLFAAAHGRSVAGQIAIACAKKHLPADGSVTLTSSVPRRQALSDSRKTNTPLLSRRGVFAVRTAGAPITKTDVSNPDVRGGGGGCLAL